MLIVRLSYSLTKVLIAPPSSELSYEKKVLMFRARIISKYDVEISKSNILFPTEKRLSACFMQAESNCTELAATPVSFLI